MLNIKKSFLSVSLGTQLCIYYPYSSASQEYNSKPIKKHIQEDLAKLQWRKPLADQPEEWYSKFKLFAPEKDTNSHFITKLQQPVDVSLKGVKNWYKKRTERIERHMQSFIPDRHQILGNDLAAAHFLVYRGGSVKFVGIKEWITRDENHEYNLPSKFDTNFRIEAIKCDSMILYYEGLQNIRRLKHLKFLSFHNVKTIDDWCLDRITGSEFENLEILDLSGTKITENGLVSLSRIPTLKMVILDNLSKNTAMKLTLIMLEEAIPDIKFVEEKKIHS